MCPHGEAMTVRPELLTPSNIAARKLLSAIVRHFHETIRLSKSPLDAIDSINKTLILITIENDLHPEAVTIEMNPMPDGISFSMRSHIKDDSIFYK